MLLSNEELIEKSLDIIVEEDKKREMFYDEVKKWQIRFFEDPQNINRAYNALEILAALEFKLIEITPFLCPAKYLIRKTRPMTYVSVPYWFFVDSIEQLEDINILSDEMRIYDLEKKDYMEPINFKIKIEIEDENNV